MSKHRRGRGPNVGMSDHRLGSTTETVTKRDPESEYFLARVVAEETTFLSLQKALGALAAERGNVFVPCPFVPRFNYVKPKELRKVFGRTIEPQQLLQGYLRTMREKGITNAAFAENPPVAMAVDVRQSTTANTKFDKTFQIKARFYCPEVAEEIDAVCAHIVPECARILHRTGNISLNIGVMKNAVHSDYVTRRAIEELFYLVPGEVSLAELDVHTNAPDPSYEALLRQHNI